MGSAASRGVRTARAALWHLRHGGPAQLRQFIRRRRMLGPYEPRGARVTSNGLAYEPWTPPQRPPARPLRVGVVLDDFSRMAFGVEWEQVLLAPSSWSEQLDGLDLVFVESATCETSLRWASSGNGDMRSPLRRPASRWTTGTCR